MMSFSHKVKTEICSNRPFCQRNRKALAYGLLLFGKSYHRDKISLHTEHKSVARLYADSISDLVQLSQSITMQEVDRTDRRSLFIVTVDSEQDRCAVLSAFGETRSIAVEQLGENDYPAFVSGAFLACGAVADPEKNYQAEFAVSDQALCAQMEQVLCERLSAPKHTVRRNDYLLYYKESEQVEDLLTYISAAHSALELMEVKIVKDLRNKVNRTTNCETANISKTIDAAVSQTEDIRLIGETCGLEALDEDLREIARLRLENPDLSLRELSAELSIPMSRSGVNHRLKRIAAFAARLRGEQTERND